MSRFDEAKKALAEASNNGEYVQARAKELIERINRILELLEQAKGILCFKDVEGDFDKLLAEYHATKDLQKKYIEKIGGKIYD